MLTNNQQFYETENQPFEPILMRALKRVRLLLPEPVELSLDLSHEEPRVRANAVQLEDALFSACLVAWQSMGGLATNIIVQTREVMLDDVVLDIGAEKLQGGLPPRCYVWIVISNNSRIQAGPFSVLLTAPEQANVYAPSAHRMRVTEMRQVVTQFHGSLNVEHEPDKGTAFEFFLPMVFPLEMPSLNASGTQMKHVMYVDDYDAMRELVGEILPDAGFRVTCFADARTALQTLRNNPHKFDAVVSDYKMQGYCGLDLLQHVKQISPDLPVVIVSGYVDDTLRSKATSAGAAMVMSKSSDLSGLCLKLKELLDCAPDPALVNYSEWAQL